MLDKAKQLWQMQKKAKDIQKELKNTEVEATSSDGLITIVISADLKVKEVKIGEDYLSADKKMELESKLLNVIGEGMSRAQAVAAEKTKALMGDLGIDLPGM